jgi:hypothetical protein
LRIIGLLEIKKSINKIKKNILLYVDWKSRMVATSGQHLPLTLIGKNVWETYSS